MRGDGRSRTVLVAFGAAAGLLSVALVAGLRRDRLWLPLAQGGFGLALGGWLVARTIDPRRDRGTLLQAALDAQEDALVLVDPQGTILASNRAVARLWRLENARLDGEAALSAAIQARVLDPGGHPGVAEEWAAGPGEVRAATLELADGRLIERRSGPLRADGQVVARLWRFRDITARASADRFVHRLAQAVEQSPVSIIITDRAGTVEFINPRFTQLTGYPLDEALGQRLSVLQPGLAAGPVQEAVQAALAEGGVWTGELQNRRRDGEPLFERATFAPLRDDAGVITHHLGLMEDITPQKRLEHQLRHAQKLEAVGLLAGGVAHDFNNLLQVINGYGSLMQLSMPAGDANRKALEEILGAAERAAQLTHSLLAFSRKQVMNPRTLDLNRIIGEVARFLRRLIGEDVRLQVTRTDLDLPVHVDQGQIEQVLLNLANNARDAMPRGGTLAISTDRVRLDEAFQQLHGFGKPGDYALIQVRDSGHGMDEATLKRIFDPFFTTKEMGHGTGLGLAMVYGTVKQHNGYIVVDSELGQGSTFQVYLPLAAAAQAGPAPAAPRESAAKGCETILLAEDEPSVRGIIETTLRQYGYTVLLAEDGQAAVDRFREHGDGIDLVLMDIIMPRLTGRQAFEQMQRLRPGLRVLFTSGYPADFIRSRGDLGEDMDLVMKPVQPLALLRKLREILDRPAAPRSPGPAEPPAGSGSPPPPAAGPV